MESINRHMEYVEYYTRQAEREAAKKNPNRGIIISALGYVRHSKARIEILNREYAEKFYAKA